MIHQVFSTSLYQEKLAQPTVIRKLNQELLREVEIFRQLDRQGQTWSKSNYIGGYTSYGSLTDLHRQSPHFAELEAQINRHVRRYAHKLKFDLSPGKLKMSTCWINIMPPKVHHSGHIHPLSVISGTYYLQIPPNSSPIRFEDPRLQMMMNSPPRRDPTALTFSVSPKAGQLVLFESWLRHEVPANTARTPRISISFNYEWFSN